MSSRPRRTIAHLLAIVMLLAVLCASAAAFAAETEPVRVVPVSAHLHESMPAQLAAAGVPSGNTAAWQIQYPGQTGYRNIGSKINNPTAATYDGALVRVYAAGEFSDPVTVTVEGHSLQRVPARAATCERAGYPEHYACVICGATFYDAQGSVAAPADALVIAPTKHIITRVNALSPTEVSDGYAEHFMCSACGQLFLDAQGAQKTTMADLFVSRIGHEYMANLNEPTCTTDGNITYSCPSCGDTYPGQSIPALGHDLAFMAQKNPTETQAGVRGHWECRTCGASFMDSEGNTLAQTSQLAIPRLSHKYQTSIKNPTCEEGGYTRSLCENCGAVTKCSPQAPGFIHGVEASG